MIEIAFTITLVIHILAAMVSLGTVAVTDYLHMIGLSNPKLERRTLFVFPHLSNLIWICLVFIYTSGFALAMMKPSVLDNPLFWVKFSMVFLVTINGYILHKYIFPKIEHHVRTQTFNPSIIKKAAFGGSLSMVTWIAIVVVSITKNTGYSPAEFIASYFIVLLIAYTIALNFEAKRNK